jgi:hypothetical protein
MELNEDAHWKSQLSYIESTEQYIRTKAAGKISSYLDFFIKNDLFHSVHTSERKAYRGCKRRWDWSYRQGYHPMVTPKPLEFGIAYHTAMEVWYEPESWDGDRNVQSQLAINAFVTVCQNQLNNYRKLNGEPTEEVYQDYRERVALGVEMVKYYTQRVSPQLDKGLRPLAVELPFEVPMPMLCRCDKCWKAWTNYLAKDNPAIVKGIFRENWPGLPVTFGGRIDAVMQDEHDRVFVFDWKQQPTDSPILTPTGWITMGEVKEGSYVIGSNGQPIKVLGVYPKGQHEVYEVIFRDGTIVECSKDHIWEVKNTATKKVLTIEAQDMIHKKYYEEFAVRIPSSPVEFDKQETKLPIHPYVLGALIGDGCFVDNTLAFSSQSGETVELLKKYIDQDVIIIDQRHHGGNRWALKGPIKDQLKSLGLWNHKSATKFIPEMYLISSVEDRILLLQGLADTDGNTGLLRITTTSEKLSQDIRELIWSLGGTANLTKSKTRLHQNGHTINVPQYGINYWLPEWIEPNQLERKRAGRKLRSKGIHRGIKEVRPTGKFKEMKCIRVDAIDCLYMTNNFILTHNTAAKIMDGDDEAAFLELDDQVGGYPVALYKLGRRVDGFIYHEQKKAVPGAPKELKRAYKNKMFSTAKDEPVEYETFLNTIMEKDLRAYNMGFYDEYLEYLQGPMKPKFYQRNTVYKTVDQMNNFWQNLIDEAHDMLDSPRIYPQASRFSCNSCLYRQPCEGKNRNEDYLYTLNSLYHRD